ncbi:MAG: HlyC/CorC family transporter [Erysipelothrix sp.]|jgi:CBS domain containing-hemolysin-like protein|nr:HlyC/CorC family transporter [Erysipelothrix sp.]
MNNELLSFSIILGVLILLSAFFSATETAFSTFNRIRMKNLLAYGNKRAKLVLELSEDFDRLLSTILIGNNIVNIASASIATALFVIYYGDLGITISTVVMTLLVLIFGEITPKSLAKEAPESFALFAAPLLKFFTLALIPLTFFFQIWKKLLNKIIKVKDDRSFTEEELIIMVEEATQDGDMEKHEGDLIRNAIEFNDLDVSDVLTPRTELTVISLHNTIQEIHEKFAESGYSRLPVFDGSIDNIIGVLHLKDFFSRRSDTITDYLKPVVHTSDNSKISKLLPLLQEQKCHLAIVYDEYGGIMGIVTLEDIIEEIVGEIWDEHDDIVNDFEEIETDVYIVNGSASVEKLFKLLDLDHESKSITVNGWIIKEIGRWPLIGDTITLDHIEAQVIEVEGRKVKKIKIVRNHIS